MGDLIFRSALLENATVMTEYDEGGWGIDLLAVPLCDVKAAPAVDAVEVVRCKDCKLWDPARTLTVIALGLKVSV